MEKNLFRLVFKRENLLLNYIFAFFYSIASFPRMVVEVFLRKNMGRRYFGIATAVTVAALLAIWPLIAYEVTENVRFYHGRGPGRSFFSEYGSWYVFLVLFLAFANERASESYPTSNVYDYDRFSLNTGQSLPFFFNLPFFKKRPNAYTVEVYLEPLAVFLVGFLLMLFNQPLGLLLIWCAIAYGFSYAAAYHAQDEELQDMIDQIIMNEEMVNAFVYGMEPEKTRGFTIPRRPSNENTRRKMASRFSSGQDTEDVDFEVV